MRVGSFTEKNVQVFSDVRMTHVITSEEERQEMFISYNARNQLGHLFDVAQNHIFARNKSHENPLMNCNPRVPKGKLFSLHPLCRACKLAVSSVTLPRQAAATACSSILSGGFVSFVVPNKGPGL